MTSLLHIAYSLSLLSFLVRDILWLRVIAIASHLCFFAVVYTRSPTPDWSILSWFVVFLVINSFHACRLIYERRLDRMTPEEEQLRAISFPALDRVSVKKLLRLGRWEDLSEGTPLTHEHEVPERLFLVAEGIVEVDVGGRVVTDLEPGHFVGEMALLAGQAASATTRTRGSTRCLVWDRAALKRRLKRDKDLRTTLYAAAGSNLSQKIAQQNKEFRSAFEQPDGSVAAAALSGA